MGASRVPLSRRGAKAWDQAIWLPGPSPDASAVGMLARHGLFLPGSSGGHEWPILEADIDPGVTGLWVEMGGTPPTVPLLAEQQRRLEEDWRSRDRNQPAGLLE